MFETKRLPSAISLLISTLCALALLTIGCQAKTEVSTIAPSNNSNIEILPLSEPLGDNSSSAESSADKKVKFTSVYTKLNSRNCKPIRKAASEDDEVPDVCNGYKGYKVFVSHHGVVTRIYVGKEISADPDKWDSEGLPMFIANKAGNGQVIEWRLANGVPFALIVRAKYERNILYPDETGTVDELVVRNLKGFSEINFSIDAAKNKNSNLLARRKADEGFKKIS